MCEWKDEWDAKSMEEKAALLARQGVRCLEPLAISKCARAARASITQCRLLAFMWLLHTF